jgi:nicotinamidase-related amidase
MRHCLLIVDLQNDYFPGGPMELVGAEDAADNAQNLLNEFRKNKAPVIHVQHMASRSGATFFLPGTQGAEIHEKVSPINNEPVVVKNFPNSFRNTQLLELLTKEKPDKLVICGAMSHMCIDATTRAAFDLGFSCMVAEDACATRNLVFKEHIVEAADVHAAFMAALSIPYARVTSTQEIINDIQS